MFANKLKDDTFIVAGSLGQLKVISDRGNEVTKIKSEKRISTPIFAVNNLIIYGNKSEIKVFEWSQ